MKRMNCVFLFLTLLYGIFSCDKQESLLSLNTVQSTVFSADGGTLNLVFAAKDNWIATTDADWLSLGLTKGNSGPVVEKVIANKNTSSLLRSGIVTVSAQGESFKVEFVQSADGILSADKQDYEVSRDAGSVNLAFTSNVTYKAKSDATWIHIGVDNKLGQLSKELTVSFDANKSNFSRVGIVTISTNVGQINFRIKQPKVDKLMVCVVGNSFIYYGGCVINGEQRHIDNGLLKRVFNSNGIDAQVYDCTYGGHHLYDFTSAGCKSTNKHGIDGRVPSGGCNGIGYDLLSDMNLGDFDVVFFSESGDNFDDFLNYCKDVMARFTNPKAQFIYLSHSYTYDKNHTSIINALPELRQMKVKTVEWGKLVYDIWKSKTVVPNTSLIFNKNTFIKNGSDNYHPNPLSGYITAQMAYCAYSGSSAVGQNYSFCNDVIDFDEYITNNYKDGQVTNFKEVFQDAGAMSGLQSLMDAYRCSLP